MSNKLQTKPRMHGGLGCEWLVIKNISLLGKLAWDMIANRDKL